MKIKFKKFSALGRVPKKETYGSACFDAYSSTEVTLRPGQTEQILLDIGFQFSKKVCCRIYPKSGLSLLPTFVGMGVIDSDYWGFLLATKHFSYFDQFSSVERWCKDRR